MKLTTKRNRWFFWRELFLYMIPMILIVGTIDVFYNFMQCPLHPEWSAPCGVIWILAAMYGIFLVLVIICEIISAKMLNKIKKKIENEFTETVSDYVKKEKKLKESKSKKIVVKKDKKSDSKISENKKVSKKTSRKIVAKK